MALTFILEVKHLQSGELKLTGRIHDIGLGKKHRTFDIFQSVSIYSIYLSSNIDKITAYHKRFSQGIHTIGLY